MKLNLEISSSEELKRFPPAAQEMGGQHTKEGPTGSC